MFVCCCCHFDSRTLRSSGRLRASGSGNAAARPRSVACSESTEADCDCWERARVDTTADFDGPPAVRTIFGYGSLIFRPGFRYSRARPACVEGFARRFWQRSVDHRGTPESPGRVLTLVRVSEVEAESGHDGTRQPVVYGLAYDVDEADWPAALEALDIRERHGYTRTVTDLLAHNTGSEGVAASLGRALVYYAHDPGGSSAYAGPEAVGDTAAIIARSVGPSGRNDQYLFSLLEALREWELPLEPYLEEQGSGVGGGRQGSARLQQQVTTQKGLNCDNRMNTDTLLTVHAMYDVMNSRTDICWHWWYFAGITDGQKQLSVGLELECFLPDLGALVPDRLVPVEKRQDLFALVAEVLSRELLEVDAAAGHRCRVRTEHPPPPPFGDSTVSTVSTLLSEERPEENNSQEKSQGSRRISAEPCDWGRLWTATADGSIQPKGANPFPVELVSKRMRFQEFDVTLFCDVVHALRSPPLRAATNESTGLHVHIGRHPRFFSVAEVAAILKAYLRFEPVINQLLLPITRQKNRFCMDLRAVLAKAHGLGDTATDEVLFALIDQVLERIRSLSLQDREALARGCRGRLRKDELTSALLGEGTLWRNKRALQLSPPQDMLTRAKANNNTDNNNNNSAEPGIRAPDASATGSGSRWLPAGMVLQEISRNGSLLWRPPTRQDLQAFWGKDGAGTEGGSDDDASDPPTPWGVLELLDDEEEVECSFCLPDGVQPQSLDLWILRDSLILDRHGARYCKLNLMRIALPSERATLEFRQFPGGNLSQTLVIWGWVKFLGLLVTHACACAAGSAGPGAGLPSEGTERALRGFLHLHTDTLLLAWFRDVQNRLPKPSEALIAMRLKWERLWSCWMASSNADLQASVKAAGSFMDACQDWRNLFQATSAVRSVFPPSDPLWSPLSQHREHCERFMQRIYTALEQHLGVYVGLLRAAEEVSRLTSLSTVVKLVLDNRKLRQTSEEVRAVQAGISETLGWGACKPEVARRIAELGKQCAELTLNHSSGLQVQKFVHPKRGDRVSLAQLQRLHHELCSWLLVPRVEEVEGLWSGLRARGWTTERVQQLESLVQKSWAQSEGLPVARAWFQAFKGRHSASLGPGSAVYN
ncbi:unnamed protein product [Polarella glacialis]|uniref:glutathione-specific gamma-glutamylcyclotransferase n=1 Tax=Polarella glacialis TaxID=89957 RepID=A0A813IM35_POLGL|nr:unnamed protein product [Polarella glacialis]